MSAGAPQLERHRHEPRRRTLTVQRTERVTPGMLQLTLGGDALAGFASLGFDDHLKVFVPGTEERRDYTPRRLDAAAGTLAIDFALHESGVVTDWALGARPGDTAEIAGPKGSTVLRGVDRWLLVGDETALPAIGRCVEQAEAGTRVDVVAAIAGAEEEQRWATTATLHVHWAHRPLARAGDPVTLLDRLATVDIGPNTFVWIAAEATVARAVRDLITGERRHPRDQVKAAGYWVQGKPAGKERLG